MSCMQAFCEASEQNYVTSHMLPGNYISSSWSSETVSYCVAQSCLKLKALPPPPKCWDYRYYTLPGSRTVGNIQDRPSCSGLLAAGLAETSGQRQPRNSVSWVHHFYRETQIFSLKLPGPQLVFMVPSRLSVSCHGPGQPGATMLFTPISLKSVLEHLALKTGTTPKSGHEMPGDF